MTSQYSSTHRAALNAPKKVILCHYCRVLIILLIVSVYVTMLLYTIVYTLSFYAEIVICG